MTSVSTDDLLLIIGSKEAQIFQLARHNAALQSEVNALAVKAFPTKPTPTNVLPFPSEVPSAPPE